MTPEPGDQALIEQVLQGRQQAYALLVQRYQSMAFTVALRYVQNREDAEEIAQQAFVKAYRNLADYRGDARFSTWLYTIVRSLSLSHLRSRRQDTLSLDREPVMAAAESASGDWTTDRQIDSRSRSRMIREAIALLGPEDAQVLTLFYTGEQSLEEIGRIMGIESNTAKVRLHRARARLKKILETRFTEELEHYHPSYNRKS